ncbi:hypothetical protein [Pedobacter steynii]
MENDAHNLQSLVEALDDLIVELTEQAVIKRVWTKDKTKLFMPRNFSSIKASPKYLVNLEISLLIA